ncbi:ubiquitin carboxyl-terminal [Plasmopara halstedii]|uniref:Ubiquitin carboxyl-terminal hydrolase n=1 Tax=Plasmopara halstedii TaxID=4781 RepID=A0A0P1AEY6_PLAHL|nr:ubiquitin carboxyl-terminal [Plasmopara halstedii]CEG38959.1 ubiquitin carboxyl-terminal [Plasmopara halstedii]|eukprot:XP_024575328.1 ubiquitin carboxyl-terminal [Plasmopara halstedii]
MSASSRLIQPSLPQLHKRKPRFSSSNDVEAPTKLAIGGPDGFSALGNDNYELEKSFNIVILSSDRQELARVSLDSPNLPLSLEEAAEAVLNHAGNAVTEEVASWQEELAFTKYADDLVQVPNPPHIASNPTAWKCQAPDCDKQENLWLNLSDGYIGCGRRNWDGSGGCGAASKHFSETGGKFPLSVKLGTITAEGGDVYSYAPDEDDMVRNPLLTKHLEHFGININNLKKTDKSMNELQVGLNLSYEFDAVTEAGKKLVPVSGAGSIGFKNLGNSCYMNSVLQLLLALPEVQERYFKESEKIFSTVNAMPVDDFAAQFSKLACAVLTDRYTKKFLSPTDGKQVEEDTLHNVDLRPSTFRSLVGKGHPDFSTGEQQDAIEYLQFLLEFMTRAERISANRLGSLFKEDTATGAEFPTANLFKFKLEDRVQCMDSNKVKYILRDDMVLQLQIPLEAATNATQVSAYQVLEQKRQRLGDTENVGKIEVIERVVPNVPFAACLERTFAPEVIEDYLFPATSRKGQAQKTVRVHSFPRYLLVQMRRYYVAENWTPKKMEVEVKVPETFSLAHFVSKGLLDGEELMPESETTKSAVVSTADEVLVSQLVSMGFSENGCKRAAIATGNSNVEAAMEWIFNHMEDSDFNDPPGLADALTKAEDGVVDVTLVSNLMAMGFAESHVKCALEQTDNNPDRAAEWLFSRMDDLDGAVAQCESQSAGPIVSEDAVKRLDTETPENYSLVGFISHIGKTTNSGHYVCHIKKNGRWLLFNDDKVALSETPPLGAGYLYLFRRIDT